MGGQGQEVDDLLAIVRSGDRDAQLDAVIALGNSAGTPLDAVLPTLLAIGPKVDSVVQFQIAVTMAKLGDRSDAVVRAMLDGLDPPPSEYATFAKWLTLEGLSYLRGHADVLERLVELAKSAEDLSVQVGAFNALGALGDPSTLDFLRSQASAGERHARRALDLFGALDFKAINAAEECPGCRRFQPVERVKGLLGERKRCTGCGKTRPA